MAIGEKNINDFIYWTYLSFFSIIANFTNIIIYYFNLKKNLYLLQKIYHIIFTFKFYFYQSGIYFSNLSIYKL